MDKYEAERLGKFRALLKGDLKAALAQEAHYLAASSREKPDADLLSLPIVQAILTARYAVLSADSMLRIKAGSPNTTPDSTEPEGSDYGDDERYMLTKILYRECRIRELQGYSDKDSPSPWDLRGAFAGAAELFEKAGVLHYDLAKKIKAVGEEYMNQLDAGEPS